MRCGGGDVLRLEASEGAVERLGRWRRSLWCWWMTLSSGGWAHPGVQWPTPEMSSRGLHVRDESRGNEKRRARQGSFCRCVSRGEG